MENILKNELGMKPYKYNLSNFTKYEKAWFLFHMLDLFGYTKFNFFVLDL